jgi:hypothetical protein
MPSTPQTPASGPSRPRGPSWTKSPWRWKLVLVTEGGKQFYSLRMDMPGVPF